MRYIYLVTLCCFFFRQADHFAGISQVTAHTKIFCYTRGAGPNNNNNNKGDDNHNAG